MANKITPDLTRPAAGRMFTDEQLRTLTHEQVKALPPDQQKTFIRESKELEKEVPVEEKKLPGGKLKKVAPKTEETTKATPKEEAPPRTFTDEQLQTLTDEQVQALPPDLQTTFAREAKELARPPAPEKKPTLRKVEAGTRVPPGPRTTAPPIEPKVTVEMKPQPPRLPRLRNLLGLMKEKLNLKNTE